MEDVIVLEMSNVYEELREENMFYGKTSCVDVAADIISRITEMNMVLSQADEAISCIEFFVHYSGSYGICFLEHRWTVEYQCDRNEVFTSYSILCM